jgi:hypothetical protein
MKNDSTHLVFTEQIDLLGLPSKQRHCVKSKLKTKEKVVNTLISSILTKSSFETGNGLLETFSKCILFTLEKIKESGQIEETLDKFILELSSDSHTKPFSASRKAVSDNLFQDTKKNLDIKLQENYITSMHTLAEHNARSKEIIMAIDGTPEETRSKYLNGQYSYVNIGQKNTWKRGFNYSGVYDATHQLYISCPHKNYHKSKHKQGQVQDFIMQLQNCCRVVEDAGSFVKIIDGDRGYYDAELFAVAYFQQLTKFCRESRDVKVIIPKKFTRGKKQKKIDFLENPKSTIITKSTINLSKYTHPTLISMCEAMGLEKEKSLFKIPIIEVAVVDEYSKKKHRNLEQLKDEWKQTKINLQKSQVRLNKLQEKYVNLQKAENIKNPKKIKKITSRKRRLFKTPELYKEYCKILNAMKYIKQLKSNQTKIIKSLMFFTISTTPNEDVNIESTKFVQLAKAYHDRWGIENGFKEDKSKFIRSVRYRKSTKRQWNLELGMILYNHWHVSRMAMMLAIKRKKVWNYVPWDPQKSYFRRRIEREQGAVLSAEGFLLRVLEYGLKLQLQKIFEG